MAENTTKKTNQKNAKSNNDSQEIMTTEQMMKTILELQEQVRLLNKNSVEDNSAMVKNEKITKNQKVKEEVVAPLTGDDDITVVNLCDGDFALSTLGYGNGKVYTFSGFGYERDIPYNELKECIHTNRSYIESGRVYIKDDRVIKKLKLNEYYDTMLDYDGIKNLKNLKPKNLYDVLVKLPVADTNTLNYGNEPKQFDIALRHILNGVRKNEFSVEQIAQVESAYKKVNEKKGKTLNINDEMEFVESVGIDIHK